MRLLTVMLDQSDQYAQTQSIFSKSSPTKEDRRFRRHVSRILQ
jgi:hypothetical protein